MKEQQRILEVYSKLDFAHGQVMPSLTSKLGLFVNFFEKRTYGNHYIETNGYLGGRIPTTGMPPAIGIAGGVGAFGALGTVSEEGITVFRAVDATEKGIIESTGKFSLQPGGVEAKYFAQSLEDANWYGQKLYPNGYSIIKGTVQSPISAAEYWYPHVDIGAYVFPQEALPFIKPH
ncbi:hypothetical protein [Pinibacter aurantiacus]|uniref:Uncharacterized protein n=1 Tax=Pinibacter aurantiacus TaxID=2851599 RepID=A0A9E2SG00_9BACT|nr:hypothetical protein [Pinibacter aurantiacus]MBV4360605.1 hypothetical protein [Pinibacter aurantiacus]